MQYLSKLSAVVLLNLSIDALATPIPEWGSSLVFSKLKDIPSAWASSGAAAKDHSMNVHIGLKQSNLESLQEHLLDISDPQSQNYGKWLSQDAVNQMTAPPDASVVLVKAWLKTHGITGIKQSSPDWIQFTATVGQMEKLLDTKYEMFTSEEGQTLPRTSQYSLPESLHDIVDMVAPTTAFYHKLAPAVDEEHSLAARTSAATCDTNTLVPSCLQQVYNVDYTPKGNALVAVTQFLTQQGSHSDFKTFGSQYSPGLADFTDVSVGGGKNSGTGTQSTLIEGNLDIQWSAALAKPNPAQFLACSQGSAPSSFEDDFSNFASYLTSANNPPTAVSASYAGQEDEFDASYMDRICNEFMKAGATGISIFFSSGDYGVGGEHQKSCSKNFFVNFPSTCPWATSVGGTEFDGSTESVAQFTSSAHGDGSSGGGFSNHFSAPSYQSNDTAAYIKSLGSTYAGKYNAKGRGYPDIALVAQHYQTIINGKAASVHGTSASAPAWAGLTSVLNDYRKSEGKPNLGFLNPLLYSSGRSGLRDITSGSNRGCDSAGYSATAGWDPATGLGSLDFAKFRALI